MKRGLGEQGAVFQGLMSAHEVRGVVITAMCQALGLGRSAEECNRELEWDACKESCSPSGESDEL